MLFDYSFPCCHLGLLGCPHSCPFRAVLLPWLMSIGFEYFDTSSLSDNFNYFLLVSSLSSEPLRPRTVEHFRSNTCFSAWRALFGLHLSHRQTRSSVFSPLLSCRDFRVMLFKFQYMIHFNFASVWNCVVFFFWFCLIFSSDFNWALQGPIGVFIKYINCAPCSHELSGSHYTLTMPVAIDMENTL